MKRKIPVLKDNQEVYRNIFIASNGNFVALNCKQVVPNGNFVVPSGKIGAPDSNYVPPGSNLLLQIAIMYPQAANWCSR